jgi:hypothetical protein
MDSVAINNLFKNLSLFELYRLSLSIHNELSNPDRIYQIKNTIAIGQTIEYLDDSTNCLTLAIVLKKTSTRLLVSNYHDNQKWWIRYHAINLTQKTISDKPPILNHNTIKVGDSLGFQYEGHIIIGKVIRLNSKTVTLKTLDDHTWRVSYNLLFPIIEAVKAEPVNKI